MSKKGSKYLDSIGIKENLISWKQLYDQINVEFKSKDEDDESIQRFKVILDRLYMLYKDTVISLLNAISDNLFLEKNSLRSLYLTKKLCEVIENLEFTYQE